MSRIDPEVAAHLEWLGFVQPIGLVVSAPALARAGAILNRRDTDGQRLLEACIEPDSSRSDDDTEPFLPDFRNFATQVLGWSFSPRDFAGTDDAPIPPELEVALPDYDETLRPDLAVREPDPQDGRPAWQLLVRVLPTGTSFDSLQRGPGHLEASAHGRMERLLRQTGVAAGLLCNGHALRLVSAPRGESSGWLDFRVADMKQTQGRPICAAMRLLLGRARLLTLPRAQRLPALLEDSRKYQNEVSERLAEQVLHALYELLRGFQAAHDTSRGELLRRPLADSPDDVYRALLTVVLRLVFLLYAEERDMLPEDETFLRSYSLAGLHERLREDAALYPDTMDQRFGAWAQLLVLFRLVHDGAACGKLHLPQRHGVLFDPDRFPFLEGRADSTPRRPGERIDIPLVPDGTLYRALEKLLVLDGERLSYRALDVEQIGSVYETMMGFRLERTAGRAIAVKAKKKSGAPTAVDLDALLAQAPGQRKKWLQDQAGRDFTDRVNKAVRDATTIDDLHAALGSAIDRNATPDLVPPSAMVLQPSEERRKSGSHYTPRVLTEPIVRTTLEPILARRREEAGGPPTPEQILDLKVCDPAMGSAAFLVESCRQLGTALVESWNHHGNKPPIPADEDEVIFARRLVAQRCLYGVDKNAMAVDLAKVSLWLATLARDHALTFVDHALRHGDSLVGLTRKQIERVRYSNRNIDPEGFENLRVRQLMERVTSLRRRIREASPDTDDSELHALWAEAREAIGGVRGLSSLLVAIYVSNDSERDRETERNALADLVVSDRVETYRPRKANATLATPVSFDWEIEFPEVFERNNAGFDAIVGNPPFAGKNTISAANGSRYLDWLKALHAESHGNADLVAHFFRRAFNLLRAGGAFGLIATNTIGQGDTRGTGLRWIRQHGGTIFAAQRRLKWPGQAAVVVSVIHIAKGPLQQTPLLDGRHVEQITAFLFHRGGDDDPARLTANAGKSFVGSYVLGMGFTFDDTDTRGVASSLAEMQRLIEKDPHNAERIFPYIGGDEVNTSPTHAHHRYVINFGEMDEDECWRRWPDLMAIVESKVKPERMGNNRAVRKRYWWRFGETTPALYRAIAGLERVLVQCRVTSHLAFTFVESGPVLDVTVNAFAIGSANTALCALQSRPHEVWARFFGSSLEDRLRYTPSDCFETFPFPEGWELDARLEEVGKDYYEFRAALMVRRNEGLTQTYNRFHDPEERADDIRELRALHATMDRAVLDAYGWTDIPTDCEFLLDYEVDDEGSSRRKKPWRYRWPDDVRDKVLARLLELNRVRAEAEQQGGARAAKKKTTARRKKPTASGRIGDLFG